MDWPAVVLTGRRVYKLSEGTAEGEPVSESDVIGSFASRELTLLKHTQQVVAQTKEFAAGASLSDPPISPPARRRVRSSLDRP